MTKKTELMKRLTLVQKELDKLNEECADEFYQSASNQLNKAWQAVFLAKELLKK